MIRYCILVFSLLLFSACGQSDSPATIPAPKTEKVILALGDSLTAGYGLPEIESYPSQLQMRLRALGYNYTLQNAGVSGDTSAGLLSRTDFVLEGVSPSLIILCIGANDAFQGKPTEDIESNIRKIIEKIQPKKIPILLAGMRAPLNLGGDYGRQYEAIFPKLAQEYQLPFMPFLLEGVALKSKLNQDDRIHPNKVGYAIVVENLFEILEEEKLIKK